MLFLYEGPLTMAISLVFLVLSAFGAGLVHKESNSSITVGSSLSPCNSSISLGSSLSPTSTPWMSSSGLYAFGFLKQGNEYAIGIYVAGIPEKTVVWTANSRFPANVTLKLSRVGLYDPAGDISVHIAHSAPENVASACMLENGNFVLYNSGEEIVWQTFEQPSNTLLPGQRLVAGQELYSSASTINYSSGKYRLKMQYDGNLVQYPANTSDTIEYAYYADNDGEEDYATLNLDGNGTIYLLNNSTINIKRIGSGRYYEEKGIYLMRLDVDGIFRLYFHSLVNRQGNWSIEWSSTKDKCAPKGICGSNSYCEMIHNVKTVCRCFPGFDAINSTDPGLGCERNFTPESCKTKEANLTYEMRTMEGVVWKDDRYEVIERNDKEGCEKACLEDCLCEAALFDNGNCRKEKLPLMYGKRLLNSSFIGLTKVAITAPRQESKKELCIFSNPFSFHNFSL